jgi:hypothetical protein
MNGALGVKVLVGVIVAIVAPARGMAEVVVRYQFPDGRKATTTITSSFQQVLTLTGKRHEVNSEQEMVVVSEAGIRDKDGELRERLRVDSLKAKLTMPGGVVLEFDSATPNAPRPRTQFDFFLDLIKLKSTATWSVVRDKENRVKSVDGQDRILEPLDPARRDMIRHQFDAEFLRDQANREMLRVPELALVVGQSWEIDEAMRLDGGQSLKFKNRYTYQGETDQQGARLLRIDFQTIEVEYELVSDGSSPLRLAHSELRPEASEGVLLFDPERGQVVESRESLHITGRLGFLLGDSELAGELELTTKKSAKTQYMDGPGDAK